MLVIGGGTAGTMAALTAAEHGAQVLLLEKAHVRHSGALAMGMDGVNNAVIPGKATPEDYVAEITRANDGIVNQRTIYQTATRGFAMVQRLETLRREVREGRARRVRRAPGPPLRLLRAADARGQGRQEGAVPACCGSARCARRSASRTGSMPVRVLTVDGRAVGAAALNSRTGEFVVVAAKAVILATGPCGRLGLPASGYLYGTYENPTNAGDGYSMAFHAGAELSGIECFQINPLIKDYNGPACAYVANPFGGYQVNAQGERFVDSDYWSGADDGRGQERDRIGARAHLPQGQPPARRDADARSRASCTPPSGRPAAPSTPTAATTTAPTTSRCTSPKSVCAAAIPPPASGSTSTPAPPFPVCTPRATWPACRTTT